MRNSYQLDGVLRFIALFGVLVMAGLQPSVDASDWLTRPSTYTHDPMTGSRVNQFAPVAAPVVQQVSNFRSSGYTHTRSTLNYGQSADNYHRVEQWGDPVRPYGEWLFPNRPYSTPYPNWGPPYAGLNVGVIGPYGNPGYGNPGYGNPGYGYGGNSNQGYGSQGNGGQGNGGAGYVPGSPAGNASPLNPYPAGPGTPYPVAPYYDGYHPNYRD